jgi:hypothetical protein
VLSKRWIWLIKSVFDCLAPNTLNKSPSRVVDANHYFTKKRYEDKYLWKPTPKIAKDIIGIIFGKEI